MARRVGRLIVGVLAGAAAIAARAAAPLLEVEAPPKLARQAAAVRALQAGDWRPLLDLVGLPRPGPPIRVVLAPEGSRAAADVASWVSGYAEPELDTIVLFPARVASYPNGNLEALLHHEVAHVMLWRAAGGGRVPRWFNEGTATVAAREWGIGDSARVVLATIGRGPRTLGEVDAGFSGDGAAAARSYAVSAALVRSLLRRYGETAVASILASVARGEAFDRAFAAATGVSEEAFAHAYFGAETFWSTWVPFVTSSTALWMAITALALLAIKRRRERDAAMRAAWAFEERGPAADGAAGRPEDGPSSWN